MLYGLEIVTVRKREEAQLEVEDVEVLFRSYKDGQDQERAQLRSAVLGTKSEAKLI